MGRMIDGEWTTRGLEADARGRFIRRASRFRHRITADGSSGYPAEAGRYHMYVAMACGWCHRVLILRQLKGLAQSISLSVVDPFMGAEGWTMADHVDPILGETVLHRVYSGLSPSYTGRVTVPVLVDRETRAIVSNESTDIAHSFDVAFDDLGAAPTRYFPSDRAAEIDAMIEANYEPVNNGVYKCGFASSQEAHDEAARALFERLDELEALLATRRYLLGDDVTAADWFLFPTLYRFDSVYYIHFKCSRRQLRDYPNLWAYTRDLYQVPGVAETCDMDATRRHYFTSHESIHPRRYVPIGPEIDFDEPHGRER